MIFALDTNAVIHFLKGVGRVRDRLLATAPSDVAIPSVVLYELEVGIIQSAQPTKRRSQLDVLLKTIQVLPLDEDAAKRAAELSGTLNRAGTPIGPMDTLIAGTVLSKGATLVTHNVSEFRRVRGLRIEDWF